MDKDVYSYVPVYLLEQWDQLGFDRMGGHTANQIKEHRDRKLLVKGCMAVLSFLFNLRSAN